MRCLTLALRLRLFGWQCRFAGDDGVCSFINPLLPEEFQPAIALGPDLHADRVFDIDTPDMLIVDHYGLGRDFEQRFNARCTLVIDDLANRSHHADWLLDQTLGRQPGDYAGFVPADCRFMVGSEFALLKPAFAQYPPNRTGRSLKRVLISLGGTDSQGLTLRILEMWRELPVELQADVIVTRAMPFRQAVLDIARDLPNVTVHCDVASLAPLMREADLAIGAGGTTSWERCATGLPTLLIRVADNQKAVIAALVRAGAGLDLGMDDSGLAVRLTAALTEFTLNPSMLADMAVAAAKICDGFGTGRVLCALAGTVRLDDDAEVRLDVMTHAESALLFEWQTLPEIRRYARNPKPPTLSEHVRWYGSRVGSPDRIFTQVLLNNKAVGMLRLDPRDGRKTAFEVSILIDPRVQGRGAGLAALQLGRRLAPAADLWAYIMEENVASQRLFKAAGYNPVGENWHLNCA